MQFSFKADLETRIKINEQGCVEVIQEVPYEDAIVMEFSPQRAIEVAEAIKLVADKSIRDMAIQQIRQRTRSESGE